MERRTVCVCISRQNRVMWFELGGSRLVQCPLSITQAPAERFQTRYKMSQALSCNAYLHTNTRLQSFIGCSANSAHYQSMATHDLGLTLCYSFSYVYAVGNDFGRIFWTWAVVFSVSPTYILPLPGCEWLNWEMIDAGCQVALEQCHQNASCQWSEWPWRPSHSLSQHPSRTTVLTPPALFSTPSSKTASLEVNKCPAGWFVFGNCQEFYWLMGWNIPICQIFSFRISRLCSGQV